MERAFFEKLDEELDKVESFYCERERDMRHRCVSFPSIAMRVRSNIVQSQIAQGAVARAEGPPASVLRAYFGCHPTVPQALRLHACDVQEAHPAAITPYPWLPLPLPAPVVPHILTHRRKHQDDTLSDHGHQLPPPTAKSVRSWKQTFSRRNSGETTRPPSVHQAHGAVEPSLPKSRVKEIESTSGDELNDVVNLELDDSKATGSQRWREKSMSKSVQALFPFRPTSPPEKKGSDTDATAIEDIRGETSGSGRSAPGSPGKVSKAPKYDPEEYQHAKKQLKKAVLECYRYVRSYLHAMTDSQAIFSRGLEVLNNYRVYQTCLPTSSALCVLILLPRL